ncbi:MAG: DNRLRE domain-containing protein, partial [Deltaproteobacteria bacterium]
LSGGQIHAISSCAWGERTITWNNQPAIDGPVLAAVGKVALKQGVDFDITAAIHGDGVYCFAIDTTSTDNVNYNSREATTGKPSVAITVAPDCGCGPAQVPNTTTTTTPVGAATTTTLAPAGAVGTVVADTYIQSDLPTTNFGTKPQIFVDNGVASNPGTTGVQHTFLRVSVSGVGASHVSSAHLQLQVANVTNSGSVIGGAIHAITGCSWDELTMTWNTAPPIDGPALVTLGVVATGQLADFDVTPAIPGDGVYCFAIDTTSTDSAIYNSREGSGLKPALVLQVAP